MPGVLGHHIPVRVGASDLGAKRDPRHPPNRTPSPRSATTHLKARTLASQAPAAAISRWRKCVQPAGRFRTPPHARLIIPVANSADVCSRAIRCGIPRTTGTVAVTAATAIHPPVRVTLRVSMSYPIGPSAHCGTPAPLSVPPRGPRRRRSPALAQCRRSPARLVCRRRR